MFVGYAGEGKQPGTDPARQDDTFQEGVASRFSMSSLRIGQLLSPDFRFCFQGYRQYALDCLWTQGPVFAEFDTTFGEMHHRRGLPAHSV